MIDLFYTEVLSASTATDLFKGRCAVKKLVLNGVAIASATVLFRDGGPTGQIKGRLTVGDGQPYSEMACKENEIVNFATGVYIQLIASGNAAVGIYMMGNPVGLQGS